MFILRLENFFFLTNFSVVLIYNLLSAIDLFFNLHQLKDIIIIIFLNNLIF